MIFTPTAVSSAELRLTRMLTSKHGMFGELVLEGKFRCVTVELPWRNNRRRESCVPVGRYKLVQHDGEKYKNVLRLEDVPDRDGCLVHPANQIADLLGCIAPGMSIGFLNGTPAAMSSRVAMDALRKVLGGYKGAYLTIVESL